MATSETAALLEKCISLPVIPFCWLGPFYFASKLLRSWNARAVSFGSVQ